MSEWLYNGSPIIDEQIPKEAMGFVYKISYEYYYDLIKHFKSAVGLEWIRDDFTQLSKW